VFLKVKKVGVNSSSSLAGGHSDEAGEAGRDRAGRALAQGILNYDISCSGYPEFMKCHTQGILIL
jgi:hypothetical protein